MEHLGQPPLYEIQKMRAADCFVDVRSVIDPDLYADVPEQRVAASRRSADLRSRALRQAHFRRAVVGQVGGIPTMAFAESQGADYDELIAMFWRAMDVDAEDLLSSGKTLASMLLPGSKLRLVTEAGTDLTLEVGERSPQLNVGRTAETVVASGPSQAWLPAGEAYVCINPKTAQGKVVVPYLSFRGVATTDIRMTFENGRMTELEAGTNSKMLKDYFALTEGDVDVLSVLDIGLNPESQPLEGSPYASFEMGGVVTLGVGDSSWAGCEVESDAGLSMHIVGATLMSDGALVVDKGRLKLD